MTKLRDGSYLVDSRFKFDTKKEAKEWIELSKPIKF